MWFDAAKTSTEPRWTWSTCCAPPRALNEIFCNSAALPAVRARPPFEHTGIPVHEKQPVGRASERAETGSQIHRPDGEAERLRGGCAEAVALYACTPANAFVPARNTCSAPTCSTPRRCDRDRGRVKPLGR